MAIHVTTKIFFQVRQVFNNFLDNPAMLHSDNS